MAGVWLVSRTVGLPIAPVPWSPERIGLPDLLTSLMEFVAVILMLRADGRLERGGAAFRAVRAGPGLAVALLVSLTLTLSALAGIATPVGH